MEQVQSRIVPLGHVLVRQRSGGTQLDPEFSVTTLRAGASYPGQSGDVMLAPGESVPITTGGGAHWTMHNINGRPRRERDAYERDQNRRVLLVLALGFIVGLVFNLWAIKHPTRNTLYYHPHSVWVWVAGFGSLQAALTLLGAAVVMLLVGIFKVVRYLLHNHAAKLALQKRLNN